MNKGMKEEKEQDKIILSKEVQKEMMKFFLRTSIPRKKKLKQEQSRLSNQNDGSEK